MAKFLELLKASIGRERQWADTRMDLAEFNFEVEEAVTSEAAPAQSHRNFPATIPMQLGRF